MTGLWITLTLIGLLTLGTRLSFILILGKWQQPKLVTLSLRFVPLAVLSALILPDILLQDGQRFLPLDLPRVAGAVVACFFAWWRKNIFLTIGSGMIVFYLIKYLI
jgi:branched-subunit amino acid transport protein